MRHRSVERGAEVRVLLVHGDVWVAEPLLEVGAAPPATYLAPEDLHLSRELGADLEAWHVDADNPLWQAIADDRDPSRIGALPEDYQPDPQHAVDGFRLTARLQRELGEHWKVLHSSSHSFASSRSEPGARPIRTLLLRALDGDPLADLIEVIGDQHRHRSASALGASPPTVAQLARWRRAFLASPSAASRADGAEVAAALQHDLGLTAQIRYWAGDTSFTS